MSMMLRNWTGLGLGTLVLGGALAACGPAGTPSPETAGTPAASPSAAPAAPAAPADDVAAATPVVGGGGEGEGGVDPLAATHDPVAYLAGLGVAEAHVRAARDAFAAGKTEVAAEMFAHPVSEALFEFEPVFQALGVAPFDELFTNASIACFDGESQDAIDARVETILAALDGAAAKAPRDARPDAVVAAAVIADLVDRSVRQYTAATNSAEYEPYLDGYGFYQTARVHYEAASAEIRAQDGELAGAIEHALDTLAGAFPGVERPASLTGDAGAMAVANSSLQLVLSGQ